MNIYSIEELCYFLVNNLYLADGEVFNENLAVWLEQELMLPRLARTLRPKFGKFADIQDLIYPVLKEINYLTYEEMKQLAFMWDNLQSLCFKCHSEIHQQMNSRSKEGHKKASEAALERWINRHT
jgi:hypothetical protein